MLIFLNLLTNLMLGLSEFYLVIAADMNTVLSNSDRSGSQVGHTKHSASIALQRLVSCLGVIDTWHVYNPSARECTFFSPRHKSFPRIDFIFISQTFFSTVRNSDLSLSDHQSLYICTD